MTSAFYVRTSTTDQDGAGQIHELRCAATARGWGECREFIDLGESGAKASRPAWDALKDAVRRGKVRQIMCTELSRFGRKLGTLIMDLDELHRLGCQVVILKQAIDYGTATGRLFAQLVGAFAEYERELSNERTRSTLAAKRAAGEKLGRPQRSVDVVRARALRAKGMSWRKVAQAVGVPQATVRRAISRVAVSKTL